MLTLNSSHFHISKIGNATDADLLAIAASISNREGELKDKILHWDFGPIMNMQFDEKASNYLFSSEVVPFHWDGAFYKVPQYLLFYCVESKGLGGETLFTNTELLWNDLSEAEKNECKSVKLRYSTEKKAHYGGEIHLSLVQTHPETGKTILRMAEKVETALNPVALSIESEQVKNTDEFYKEMCRKLYDPKYLYEHQWKKGDLLICDNFTYLHGRRALKNNLLRSFKRIQIL